MWFFMRLFSDTFFLMSYSRMSISRHNLRSHISPNTFTATQDLNQVWAELRAQNILDFSYQEKSTAYGLAPFLSRQMAVYPMEHVLSEGWLLDEMTEEELARVIDISKSYLRPERSVTVLRNQQLYKQWIAEDNIHITNPYHSDCVDMAVELLTKSGDGVGSDTDTVGDTSEPSAPNRVEMWYGTPYHLEKLPNALVADLYDVLAGGATQSSSADMPDMVHAFPKPNRYVSFDTIKAYDPKAEVEKGETCSQEKGKDGTGEIVGITACAEKKLRSEPPRKIINEDEAIPALAAEQCGMKAQIAKVKRRQLWHSTDEAFKQPRSQINLYLRSVAGVDAHPTNSLIASVFYQAVATKLYPAQVAGLSYSTSCSIRGVGFSVSGYSHKLPELLEDMVKDFSSQDFWAAVDPALVELCKEKMLRALRSWNKERPDSQCDTLLSYLLSETTQYLPWERLALAEQMSKASMARRVKDIFAGVTGTTMHSHGDTDVATATQIHDRMVSQLSKVNGGFIDMPALVKMQEEKSVGLTDSNQRARLLVRGSHVLRFPSFNEQGENSALLVHFQTARMDPKVSAVMLYLRRYLAQPMFDTLRTKKQLGYIVSLGSGGYGRSGRYNKAMRGFTARVLSNRFSPDEIFQELETFLDDMAERIGTIMQADVDSLAAVLISSLSDPPITYREEADNFWECLLDERGFDWTDRIIDELQQLKKEDVQAAFQAWFRDQPPPRGGHVHEGRLYLQEGRRSVAMMLYGKDHMGEGRLSGQETRAKGRKGALDALVRMRGELEYFDPPDEPRT